MKFLMSLVVVSILALSNQSTTLSIKFQNIEKEHLGKYLYIGYWENNDPNFPEADKVQIKQRIKIESLSPKVSQELQSGTYAISAYIDMNDNEKLDENFFGKPKEPYFLSNGFIPKLSKPDFEDCGFKVNGDMVIELEVID